MTEWTRLSNNQYPAETYSSSCIHFAIVFFCVRSMEIFRVSFDGSQSCCNLSCYDNSFSAFYQACSFWYTHRSDTGLEAHQTEPLLGTYFSFLFVVLVPGGGKTQICLERQPMPSAGIQAIFFLE